MKSAIVQTERYCLFVNLAIVEEEPQKTGEYIYEIFWKGKSSRAAFIVFPDLEQLAKKRCRFLVEHQQCYGHRNDHSGGREELFDPSTGRVYNDIDYLTGEEKFWREALKQMELLDLFQGFHPDYHLNEVAIRHWDDYWFGKRHLLGDTFPHYWSVLSGYAEYLAAGFAEARKYSQKCERTLRGTLSLFNEDGSASCAMIYPMSVNGKAGAF